VIDTHVVNFFSAVTYLSISIPPYERTNYSISWDYDPKTKILSLEDYEMNREPRRTHFEMVLPRDVRQQILRKEWDVSQQQIASAVRANIKIKNQRRATVNNLGKLTKIEELMDLTGRKLMRGLLLKKSVSKQVADLERKYEEAERNRKKAFLELQMVDDYYEGKTEDETMSEDRIAL
jgi:hypothetical protein